MSLGIALRLAYRELSRLHPELPDAERAQLAAEFVDRGWVALRGDNASVCFADGCRTRAPRMPYSSDAELDARVRRHRGEPPAAAPPPPVQRAVPVARSTDDIQADLARLTGTDDRSKSKRAVLREELARAANATSAISSDLDADLAAARKPEERARIREAHARAKLGPAYNPTRENP
jgi:hypothetical protein